MKYNHNPENHPEYKNAIQKLDFEDKHPQSISNNSLLSNKICKSKLTSINSYIHKNHDIDTLNLTQHSLNSILSIQASDLEDSILMTNDDSLIVDVNLNTRGQMNKDKVKELESNEEYLKYFTDLVNLDRNIKDGVQYQEQDEEFKTPYNVKLKDNSNNNNI